MGSVVVAFCPGGTGLARKSARDIEPYVHRTRTGACATVRVPTVGAHLAVMRHLIPPAWENRLG